jgi:polygalacturonase
MKLIKTGFLCLVSIFTTLYVFAQTPEYSWDNLPVITQPIFKPDTFNIIQYGAIADGITLNTESINAAINDCSSKGGGVVLILQGLWMTGPVVLKSDVNLCVSRAALLQFTNDKSKYKLVEGNYEGHSSPRNESPISGTDLINIAITGEGIIDAHGEAWRAVGKDKITESDWKQLVASGGALSDDGKTWYPSDNYVKGLKTKDAIYMQPGKSIDDYQDMKDFFRPNMVVLNNCKNVLLQNTTFQNSPAWCLHMLLCENLTLRNVKVRNPWNAQNGDGIDVESCKDVLIEGSTFDAGDDGICVKSGRDEAGRRRGKPTENMIVRNDVVYRAHGGFVIGSEMSGGAKNIFVSDCSFIGTDIGLRFKTTRGRGGVVEKIYIKNINMKNIVHEAILFDMYYQVKEDDNATVPAVDESTPQFKNFYVNNVVCDGAEKGIMIRGLPEMPIKDIHLENIILKTQKGVELTKASNVSLKNITLLSQDTDPLINLINSNDITFDNIKYTTDTKLLFSINGNQSKQINILNTDTSKAQKQVEFNNGADTNALIIK